MTLDAFKTNAIVFATFLSEQYGLQNFKVDQIDTPTGGCFRIHNVTSEGVTEELICKVNTHNTQDLPYMGMFKVCHPSKQAAVMRHLLKSGLICSQPISSVRGNDAESYGDPNTVAIVLTYLPGTVLYGEHIDHQSKYNVGVLVGSYRQAMEDFEHNEFPKLTSRQILEDCDLSHLLHMCAPPSGYSETEQLRYIITSSFEKVEARMEKLPTGVCHGDPWAGNIIRINGKPKTGTALEQFGLIDFDFCGTSFPVLDLAHSFLSITLTDESEDIITETRPIVDGYCSVASLTEEEKLTLQYAFCIKLARLLVFTINIPVDHPHPGPQFLRSKIELMLRRLVLIRENNEDVIYKKWFG